MPLIRRSEVDRRGGRRIGLRLFLALAFAGIALVTYLSRSTTNPVTGRTQYIALSHEQEIALGVNSAPEMARQFGGLTSDARMDALVDAVGARLIEVLPPEAPQYPFQFHVLADRSTVNAFALPGGQVFITEALLERMETEGQLAGVLGHEIGHVVGRHGSERMAKQEFAQALVGAVGVAASDSPESARMAQAAAAMVGNVINLKYGREDELESDTLGLRFMLAAGYDPRAMVRVMEILREANDSGSGGGRPEFMSTHPDPGNRIQRIKEWITEQFAAGVPPGLTP